MIPAARQNQILRWLEQEGYIATTDLVNRLKVSQMTIWRDLQELENRGELHRVYGGAELVNHPEQITKPQIPLRDLQTIRLPDTFRFGRKSIIGEVAASTLIEDNDCVIMEGGSTVANLIPHITAENVTVLTNGLFTILLSQSYATIANLLCSGGVLNQETRTFIGPRAESFFRNYQVDKVFISAYSYIPGEGFFDPTPLYDSMKRTLCSRAKQIIMLLESVKIHRQAFSQVLDESSVDLLVTDAGISDEDLAAIEDQGLKVLVAGKGNQ